MPKENKEQIEALLRLIEDALGCDKALREKYKIGQKFRFIQDRLTELQRCIQEKLTELRLASGEKNQDELSEDEILICVYLYNSQGLVLKTWQNMLNPAVFYEYSVNRPIYAEKDQVEGFIRRKPNKVQHAYLTVAIKKVDMLVSNEKVVDSVGHPVIKVREGSLRFEKLISFTHNEIDYVVGESGELIKKSS